MVRVDTTIEMCRCDKEVLLCRFHLPNPYPCVRGTARNLKPCNENARCHSVMYFEHVLFCCVRMALRTEKLNDAFIRQLIRYCDGEIAINKKEWRDYRIYPDPADRRRFPPQQQHKIIALATEPPQPEGCPISHWSMSDLQWAVLEKGITDTISVATIWRLLDQAAIKPHRWHYWLHSRDPDFDLKMLDIVELYLKAPTLYSRNEIVLSVDEKTSIQALQRKYPSLPVKSRLPELREHEYIRHGTRCLTAGFEVATGSVMGMLTADRPAEIFAEFMAWACDYYKEMAQLHFVLDNLNTHYHEQVCRVVADVCGVESGDLTTGDQRKAFLCNPNKWVVFHFTPSHASWLNQIEIWFSTLSRKVLHRGDFSSTEDLEDKIIEFITYYNEVLAKPYKWTYTGKPLAKAS